MKQRDVANVIILNARKEVLLQKKDLSYKPWPGRWALFGGGLETGEDAELAMQRELEEEIGLDVGKLELYKTITYEETNRSGLMHIFTASFGHKVSDISLGEGAGFAFFAEEELDQLKLIDHDDLILKGYFASI